MIRILHVVGMIFLAAVCTAQKKIIPAFEAGSGRIVPNYLSDYPSASVRADVAVTFLPLFRENRWSSFFGYPDAGLTLRASYTGNARIFGYQFSLYPSIKFYSGKQGRTVFNFGMGPTYFTRIFNEYSNPHNQAIGSSVNWHFNAGIGRVVVSSSRGELQTHITYHHASNGHTQIPNYGLNGALWSIEFIPREKRNMPTVTFDRRRDRWALEWRSGIGFHELAGTWEPVNTPKYAIYTSGIHLCYIRNEHIRFKAGFYGRFYNSYYRHIRDTEQKTDFARAGAVYFMGGCEFLLGHFGIDIEGGLNLYKPYYRFFFDTFERGSEFDYILKRWLNSRLGLNYYIIHNEHVRRFNVKCGAHINANFGQADFSEFSVGLEYRFR